MSTASPFRTPPDDTTLLAQHLQEYQRMQEEGNRAAKAQRRANITAAGAAALGTKEAAGVASIMAGRARAAQADSAGQSQQLKMLMELLIKQAETGQGNSPESLQTLPPDLQLGMRDYSRGQQEQKGSQLDLMRAYNTMQQMPGQLLGSAFSDEGEFQPGREEILTGQLPQQVQQRRSEQYSQAQATAEHAENLTEAFPLSAVMSLGAENIKAATGTKQEARMKTPQPSAAESYRAYLTQRMQKARTDNDPHTTPMSILEESMIKGEFIMNPTELEALRQSMATGTAARLMVEHPELSTEQLIAISRKNWGLDPKLPEAEALARGAISQSEEEGKLRARTGRQADVLRQKETQQDVNKQDALNRLNLPPGTPAPQGQTLPAPTIDPSMVQRNPDGSITFSPGTTPTIPAPQPPGVPSTPTQLAPVTTPQPTTSPQETRTPEETRGAREQDSLLPSSDDPTLPSGLRLELQKKRQELDTNAKRLEQQRQITRTSPLSPDLAARLGKDPRTTPADLEKDPQLGLITERALREVEASGDVLSFLDMMEALWVGSSPYRSKLQARTLGNIVNTTGSMSPNSAVKEYLAMHEGFGGRMASMGGENPGRGLTDNDIARIRKIIPRYDSTESEGIALFAKGRSEAIGQLERRLQSGQQVPWYQDYKKRRSLLQKLAPKK